MGPWHAAGLRHRTWGLATRWVYPRTAMGQECGGLLREPIGETQGHTVGRQDLGHLMADARRHGQGTVAPVERQEQRGDGVERSSDPVRRA
jgi:hypothetical protein